MNHVITTYGGGELFTLVFNGIAALFKTDHTGLVMSLIRVGLMVGSVYVVILMLFKSQVIEGFKWFLWVVVATNLLFLPKTTIYIHDPLCNTKSKVDNVPFALGAFAATVSQVGRSITEQFESVFTLPDYMPYHKTGTVFASQLMSQVGQFRIVDSVFKGNMERFVNQCIVYDAMIGHKYTLDDLQKTSNIWELVTSNASPVLGFLYKNDNDPGEVVTCKTGATLLSKLWADQIEKATILYGSRVNNRTLNANAFNSNLLSGAKLLSGSLALANSATDILKQEMMINAIEEASNNKLSELGSASNYAATKALLQQRSAYAAAGEIAARTLPLFKNVIEALSYALFIFIVILALLPNGYRTVLTYCGILAWTQLWAPLYAVLNLIMTLYGKHESMGHGLQDGLTLLNSSAIINANADMVTLAAWLSVSIPFISYGILKQGAAAFVGLAQHLGSAMTSAASSAAAETVSGNISMGNVNMGTQAYQNTSAFQHNTSPSYNASQFKNMGSSGIEKNTYGDGTQSFNDYAMSSLPVKLMGTTNTSMEHQQRLHEAQTLANSKMVAAGESMDAAYAQTSTVLERVGSDFSKHANDSKTFTSNEVKALQDHHNFTNDLSENLGVSKSRAHELAVAVQGGTPKWLGASIEGSTRLSGSTAHSEQLQKAQSIADQKGYSYSLDTALSVAHSIMESRGDTKGAELASGASASLNHASHLREETTLAHTAVKEASDSVASSQRRDFQESRDMTQPFLEYVAKQPANNGPGTASSPIGNDRAVGILNSGGAEYEAYSRGFKEAHPAYDIQRISTSGAQQGFESQYHAQSSSFKGNHSPDSHHAQNKQSVEQKAQNLGLSQEAFKGSSLKQEVEQKHMQAADKFKVREEDIAKQTTPLQKKVDTGRNETVVGSNLKQIGKPALATIGLEKLFDSSGETPQDKTPTSLDKRRN